MGILQRFGEIMESNINALLDKAEDPVKMSQQMLRKLNEQLAEVKDETATVMAQETAAQRRVDELQKKVDEYTSSAKKALQAGNEGDARKLLQSKQEYEAQLSTAQNNLQVCKTNSSNMQAMYNKLSTDISTLTSRIQNVQAQTAMASAQERANKITDKMGKTNATDTFSRMEAKAQERLDKAMAKTQLAGIGAPEDEASVISQKYTVGSSASVDSELEAMKKELGL